MSRRRSRCQPDRRAHRHRRERSRRIDGPRGAARRGPAEALANRGLECHRPRQPHRPGQSVAAAGGRLPSPCARCRVEPPGARRGARRARSDTPADPARRRSLPRRSARSARSRVIAAKRGKQAARAVARRARRLQHQRAVAERQHARHAGRVPVRLRAARADRDRRLRCRRSVRRWIRQIGIRSVDAGEKRFVHEQGLEVFDMRYIDEMGMRHTMELALAGHGCRTRICTSASTSTSSIRTSHRASARRCPAARPTAKRSCAWR